MREKVPVFERYNIGWLRPFLGKSAGKKGNAQKKLVAQIGPFSDPKPAPTFPNLPNPTSKTGKPVPAKGGCRRCKRNIPINRLKLCYECFVKINLLNGGWTRFDIHPDWCHCTLKVPHLGRQGANN